MNTVRKIVKNSGASLLERVSTPIASFALVFFIARLSGVSGLGTFSSALALLYIFQAFTSLGFPYLITRAVAQDKSTADKYLVNASFSGAIFSILVAAVMCLTVNLITDNVELIRGGYVLSLSLLPYTLYLVSQSICRAFEKLEYIAIPTIAGNAFKLILGPLLLFMGYGLLSLMIVILFSHVLIFILSLYFTLKVVQKPVSKFHKLDLGFCKGIIKAAPVFALILIFSAIRSNIDFILLSKLMGELEVGFYSAAYKIMNISKLGISCYILALQPVIFKLFSLSLEKFKLICEDSVRYLFIMILPIIAGVAILNTRIILLIFKQDFLPSANVLSILIWILLFFAFNQIFANALIASNNQKVNLQANIIGMISNIGLNLLLIPQFGFMGAAIANIASTLMVLVFQYSFISKHLFKVNFIRHAKRPAIAAALMGVFVFLFKEINLFLLIFAAVILYLSFIFAFKTFSARDKALFRKLFKGEDDLAVAQNGID